MRRSVAKLVDSVPVAEVEADRQKGRQAPLRHFQLHAIPSTGSMNCCRGTGKLPMKESTRPSSKRNSAEIVSQLAHWIHCGQPFVMTFDLVGSVHPATYDITQ